MYSSEDIFWATSEAEVLISATSVTLHDGVFTSVRMMIDDHTDDLNHRFRREKACSVIPLRDLLLIVHPEKENTFAQSALARCELSQTILPFFVVATFPSLQTAMHPSSYRQADILTTRSSIISKVCIMISNGLVEDSCL